MRTVALLLGILVGISSAHAQAATTDAPPVVAPVAPTAPAAHAPAPAASETSLPFRLGLFYSKAFGQSGNLAAGPAPAALGLDIGIGMGRIVRYHLGIANEWESRGAYSAKGFRLDLVSLGFPIPVVNSDGLVVHIEPIARIIRGEILFPSGQGTGALFRVESGFALTVTAAIAHWFIAVEPLSLDFRSFSAYTAYGGGTLTGSSRLWWFQITAGREF